MNVAPESPRSPLPPLPLAPGPISAQKLALRDLLEASSAKGKGVQGSGEGKGPGEGKGKGKGKSKGKGKGDPTDDDVDDDADDDGDVHDDPAQPARQLDENGYRKGNPAGKGKGKHDIFLCDDICPIAVALRCRVRT